MSRHKSPPQEAKRLEHVSIYKKHCSMNSQGSPVNTKSLQRITLKTQYKEWANIRVRYPQKNTRCTSECSGVRAQRFVFRMKSQPQTDNTQKVVQLHSRQSEGKLVAIHRWPVQCQNENSLLEGSPRNSCGEVIHYTGNEDWTIVGNPALQ